MKLINKEMKNQILRNTRVFLRPIRGTKRTTVFAKCTPEIG